MATLAKLVVKLVTDVSEFEAGMKAASKKMEKIGEDMKNVGGQMTKYMTLPIAAAGVAAVKFAADLNDALDNSTQVFGKSAAEIEAWSNTAADRLGMSKAAAIQAAVGFGQFLEGMGNSQAASAKMSESIIGLATDLAELNHTDVNTMMDALQSGLAGRAMGLKKYGIVLDDTTLKQRAMTMGIWDGTSAFTDAIKSQAAYAEIMRQTADKQGYYANQTGDIGKSLATLKSKLEDVGASFGQIIIPVLVKFLNALIPILDAINKLPEPVKTGIVIFLAFLATLGPIISMLGTIISIGANLAGLFGAGGALASMGPVLAGLFSGFLPALGAIASFITGTLIPAIGAIAFPVVAIGMALLALGLVIKIFGAQAWSTILMIGDIFRLLPLWVSLHMGEVKTALAKGLRSAVQSIGDWASSMYRAGQALMSGFVQGIVSWAVTLYQTVMHIVQSVIDAVKNLLGISSPSKVFANVGKNMMLGLRAGIDEFAGQPVQATINATAATLPAARAIQSGGGRSLVLQIPAVTITGDLSDSQLERLDERVRGIFGDAFVQVFGDA